MPRKTRWETVLEAAAALFAANGYAGASVSQLARQARLSKPGIYYHVRGKEELLFRICHYSMAGILAAGQAAVGTTDDPVVQLRRLVRAHLAFYWRHLNELVILF